MAGPEEKDLQEQEPVEGQAAAEAPESEDANEVTPDSVEQASAESQAAESEDAGSEGAEPRDAESEAAESEAAESQAAESQAAESQAAEAAADTAEEAPVEDSAEDEAGGGEELNLGQERVLEFLSYVMVNLVDHPEDVKIDLVRRDDRDVYKVRVHEEDLGKVIGKGGQTARALRVMLTALSSRTDQRVGLDIVE